MVDMSYTLFGDSDSGSAKVPMSQLIAFTLLGGHEHRLLELGLYNDSIMALYIFLAIATLSRGSPMVSIFWFSMALSLKAAGLLLVPGLLGMIQHNHGTWYLILGVIFLIAFQAVLALPFTLGETSWKAYLERSRLLGTGSGGSFGRRQVYEVMASSHLHTITWGWIPEEIFEGRAAELRQVLVGSTLFLNVWFFFVRKNLLPTCVQNLLNAFSSGKGVPMTLAKRRLAIEVCLVLWAVGCAFAPGAHLQFQLWWLALFPVLLALTPLPAWLVTLLHLELLPVHPDWRRAHHVVNETQYKLVPFGTEAHRSKHNWHHLVLAGSVLWIIFGPQRASPSTHYEENGKVEKSKKNK